MDYDPFVNLTEAARLLNRERTGIWRMRARGDLPPAVRISARVVGWPKSIFDRVLDGTWQKERSAKATTPKVGDIV